MRTAPPASQASAFACGVRWSLRGDALLLQLLPIAHHSHRDWCCVLTTATAVLDDHDDRYFGGFGGRVAREPGVIAVEVPDLVGVHPARCHVADLSGAGLA